MTIYSPNALGAKKRMLLIGGGLKICSSYSTKNCTQKTVFNDSAYKSTSFLVNSENIKVVRDDEFKLFDKQSQLNDLVELLNKYKQRFENKPIGRSDLLKRLDNLKLSSNQKVGQKILNTLNARQWNYVFQNLQQPVVDEKGKPLTEYVMLDRSNKDSIAIINQFVDMVRLASRDSKPTILFSTASANDVFDAASFYLQLFRSYEVEAVWLPIEASLNRVMSDPQ